MGSSISEEEIEDIVRSLHNSYNKLCININNLWKYIYNKDEKKHMQ